MKVVINAGYGGFGLSLEANEALIKRGYSFTLHGHPSFRADPDLVEVVETLGKRANGKHANLKIVEIPDGVEYTIEEYGGIESIHEKHRSWE